MNKKTESFIKARRQILSIFALTVAFCFFVVTEAQGVKIDPPFEGDLQDLVNRVVLFVQRLAFYIAPILFIVAGVMYYLAGGNPEQAKKATDMVKWTLIGVAVVIIASSIQSLVTNFMGVDDGSGMMIIEKFFS